MSIEIINGFKPTWEWFIALVERVFGDIFGFIATEEGWE